LVPVSLPNPLPTPISNGLSKLEDLLQTLFMNETQATGKDLKIEVK
jgi:hypothetical protein